MSHTSLHKSRTTRKRKHNPHSDAGQMSKALQDIKENLVPYPFKYIGGSVSTLGGMHRPTIMLRVSLQSKDEWKNGILENSDYALVSIRHDGVMEMFSGSMKPKLRKTSISSTHEAIVKLHIWAEKALTTK